MATAKSIDLLSNASATSGGFDWPGGPGAVFVAGTVGGSTVSLQTLGPDATTWLDVGTNTTFIAVGGGGFQLPAGSIRAAVTGGTPSGLYVRVAGIPQG